MSDLLPSLHNRTATELRRICTRLAISPPTTTTKQACATSIAHFWLDDPQRAAVLDTFSSAAHTALQRLLQFDSIPRPLFCAEFGNLRPARNAYPGHLSPWRTPQSACEELAYAGLLYGVDARPLHKTAAFLLPHQLRPILRSWLAHKPSTPAQPKRFDAPDSCACTLLHDVAELLAILHRCRRHGPPLRHNGWLHADALRQLNLSLLHPDPLPLPRSHKRTRRLRYLSFWAAAAKLHAGGMLTPGGWSWLDLPASQQIECLWQGWRSASGLLRIAFAWPDALLPEPWPDPLWQVLRLQSGAWSPTQISAGLLALAEIPAAYWVANLDGTHTLDEIVHELCSGPLAHFGMVAWETASPSEHSRFRLTDLGRELLNDLPPTVACRPPAAHCTWRQEHEAVVIERPAGVLTRGVVVVAACAQQRSVHYSQDGSSHTYRLTEPSLRQAAQQGLPAPLLLDALQTLNLSLSPELTERLLAWLEPPARVDVDLVTLLRTATGAGMAALHSDKQIAVHLQSLLSPAAAVLDLTPDAARALLRQRGFAAPPPALHPVQAPAAREAELASTWLAGQLYTLLRQFLPLPLEPPLSLLDEFYAALPSAQQALLTAWRDLLAQKLLDLIDGRSFTPPPHPSDPEQWRPLLQSAMDKGEWLEMLYFSPARNLLVRRHIQPAWFSRQHGADYVLADCQEAGAVLTFRLDRIHTLQPMPPSV